MANANKNVKKFVDSWTPILILGIFFVIWNILVFTITKKVGDQKIFFWGAYGFITASFIFFVAALFLLKLNKNINFSVALPAYLVLIIYFVINFIMDSIFMGNGTKDNATAVMVPNVILLLLALVAFIVALKGLTHIEKNNAVINQKVTSLKKTVIALKQIGNIAEDETVKAEVAKLAEKVDYSDPMGNQETADLEDQFSQRVASLRLMVEDDTPAETILKAIRSAEYLLQERNETLRAVK